MLKEEKKLAQHKEVDAGDATPNTRFRKEAEAVGWGKILCDPLYSVCTYSICALAAFNQATGVNSINVYSQQIFENIQEESGGGGISPRVGNCLTTLAQFVAVFFAPFVATCLSLKQIFVIGMFLMAIALGLIGLFAQMNLNTWVVIMMMIHLTIYQLSMGTYMFVYVAQVAEERAQTLGIGVTWFFVTVLTLLTNTLFDTLGNAGTFWLFGGLTLIGAIVLQFVIRETKGLTQDEIKRLYWP